MGEEDVDSRPRGRGRPRKPPQDVAFKGSKIRGRPRTELWGQKHFLQQQRKKDVNGIDRTEAEEEDEAEDNDVDEVQSEDFDNDKHKDNDKNVKDKNSFASVKGNFFKNEGSEMTVLTSAPPASQKDRWRLRGMWQLASVLHFLHVFRPILKIDIEFSAEELETALITPNNTLSRLHIQLLKGIPPVSKALSRDTWVPALCRKLSEWWKWVAEGQLPLAANRGEENAAYQELDPCDRVLMLKAVCEVRAEQDDIWKHIDVSVKHSKTISAFHKERFGGDSHGTSYWYDADSIIGHRLYREIHKIESKLKPKGKGRTAEPIITCQWETVATNLDEFQAVSEKLVSSRNKMEATVGKKIQNDIIPVIEELQKKKERVLKRQQRQASLLDSFLITQGDGAGRSRRDRKPVKYTFDDYDRSIEEAIQITKKGRSTSDNLNRRDASKENTYANGHANGLVTDTLPSDNNLNIESNAGNPGRVTRSNTHRVPLNISDVDAVDKDANMLETDDVSISNNERGVSSSGAENEDKDGTEDDYKEEEDDIEEDYKEDDGDEEYKEEEDELEEEDEALDDDDSDINEDFRDQHIQRRRSTRRTRRNRVFSESEDDASISDDDLSEDEKRYATRRKKPKIPNQYPGLRRSKRVTRVDYSKYELSNSEEETSTKDEKELRTKSRNKSFTVESDAESGDNSDMQSESSQLEDSDYVKEESKPDVVLDSNIKSHEASGEETLIRSWEQLGERSLDIRNQRFIDLNEAAPLADLDDDPNMVDQSHLEHLGYDHRQERKNQ